MVLAAICKEDLNSLTYNISMSWFYIILFIFFLVITIISGRVFTQIKKSGCYTSSPDTYIKSAYTWSAWGIGIGAVGMVLSLVGLFIDFRKKKE